MLALDGPARAWEPKRLRLRLFTAAGRLVAAAAACGCASPRPGPGGRQITAAITRLQAYAPG